MKTEPAKEKHRSFVADIQEIRRRARWERARSRKDTSPLVHRNHFIDRELMLPESLTR